VIAARPTFTFIEYRCAGCAENPCVCRAEVRCVCLCGGLLIAVDSIESKRDSAELHAGTAHHLAWRGRRT
jgi:hypothetical protein